MEARERLCIALDVPTLREAEKIVDDIADIVGMFKIGLQLYTAEGPRIVNAIHGLGGRVFLDLKFHDIPNTVAAAAREVVRLNVAMFNLHASGGLAMMSAARQAVLEEADRLGVPAPRVLAVTVLTSISQPQLRNELGVEHELKSQVLALAELAATANLDGVVASPKETQSIRKARGSGFVVVTPGIRPTWAADVADQKRVTTPSDAIKAGSDILVVGRPVLAANNKRAAAMKIVREIETRVET